MMHIKYEICQKTYFYKHGRESENKLTKFRNDIDHLNAPGQAGTRFEDTNTMVPEVSARYLHSKVTL